MNYESRIMNNTKQISRIMTVIPNSLFPILLTAFLIPNSLFLIPKPAYAGLIMGAPKYAGLSSGLVGYWSFNGPDMEFRANRAYDRSGLGNDGTLFNMSTSSSPVDGKIGQALSFDGVDDSVAPVNPDGLNLPNSHSISLWAKTNQLNVSQTIIAVGGSGCCGDEYSIYIDYSAGGGTYRITYTNSIQGSANPLTYGANVIPGRWYHVAVVWNGSRGVMYIDGNPERDIQMAGTLTQYASRAQIGSGDCCGSPAFSGILDDVRIYNRALSSDEIKRLYKIGATLKMGVSKANDTLANGLVGWWTFDGPDMAGNIAYDRGGTTTENGTLTNGPIRTEGKLGQALSFDGVNDFVNISGTTGITNLTSATWSAWLAPDLNESKYFLKAVNGEFGSVYNYFLIDNAGTELNAPIFKSSVRIGGSATMRQSSAISSPTGNWIHFAYSYDGSAERIYVNGQLKGEWSISGTLWGNTEAGLYIGGNPSVDVYKGKIDDVRVYNRALTADEIKRLYKIGATLKMGVPKSNDTLQNGLIGWWTFDGSDMAGNIAYDKAGTTTENGTLTNGATRAEGRIGQGIFLDGEDDYVNGGGEKIYNFAQTDSVFSISAWVKSDDFLNSFQNTLTIASKWATGNRSWFLMISSPLSTPDELKPRFGFSQDGLSAAVTVTSDVKLTFNDWHHVTATADIGRDVFKIYIDGKEVTTTGSAAVSSLFNGTSNINIGSTKNGTDDRFRGSIDDVRIYNRVLTANEVKRLYNMGK